MLTICIFTISFLLRPKTQTIPAQSAQNSCVQIRSDLERLSCPGTIANDWGELNLYRDANARLAPAASEPPRVVFIGDSLTLGWPALGATGHFAGFEVISRGITSQVTSQILLRFRQDVVDLHPRIVVILAGTNDLARVIPPALPVIESNLASMAQLAKANGIRVVLSSLPPVNDSGHEPNGEPVIRSKTHSSHQIRELNDWIKRFAKQNSFIFLDYYSAMVDRQGFLKMEYSQDGMHPNATGYSVMEPLAAQAIKDSLH